MRGLKDWIKRYIITVHLIILVILQVQITPAKKKWELCCQIWSWMLCETLSKLTAHRSRDFNSPHKYITDNICNSFECRARWDVFSQHGARKPPDGRDSEVTTTHCSAQINRTLSRVSVFIFIWSAYGALMANISKD